MTIPTRYTIRPLVCPHCSRSSNMVMGDLGAGGGPEAGDYNICVYCRQVSIYNDDFTVRRPTGEELIEFLKDNVPEGLLEAVLADIKSGRGDP